MIRKKNKSRSSFFSKAMLFFNAVAVLLLLVSYFAPFVSPAKLWPVAIIGLGYPALLPVNLFFIVYWIFFRWKFAFISLTGILAGWNILLSSIGFRPAERIGAAKASEAFLRVMTYNVHYWRTFTDNVNSPLNKEFMLEVIRKEQPDILCLQEFYTANNKDFNTRESLKEILGTKYVYLVDMIFSHDQEQGLAIFSKYPIVNKGSILFPDTERGNEAMFADINYKGKVIRVYNVHFQSIGFQPEDYQYLKDVKDINTDDVKPSKRIGSRLKRAFIKRANQAEFLKAHTKTCQTPFVVMGDFNDTPISYVLNTMTKGLNNTFRDKGSGIGVTYNGDFPNFQIDYILTSPQFTTISYLIPKKKISDHYAVRSDLKLK